MTGHLKRLALVSLMAVGLGACGLFQGSLFQDSFWASSPLRQNDEAELGIAELAKGNYVTAEGHFKRALKANPKDIHALLGSGILYQNTGQLTKAREMYEAVLAIRPDDSTQFVVWSNLSTRPASQIASVNLSLLDSGGVSTAMASAVQLPSAVPAPMAPAAMPQPTPPVASAPSGSAMLGRPPMAAPDAPPQQAAIAVPSPATMGKFAGGDGNVVSRFATLRALRDQGLITEQEFQARRRVNLGALLPMSAPPPAAGLDRPVPATEQISGRLRAIGRALEMRAISVSQHSAERSMILDALMPVAPVVVANPAPPPQGLLEAADAVRRLEQLRDGGFISSDEYSKERQAIELAMQPPPPKPVSAAPTPPKPEAKAEEPKKPEGPQPGVHLASYRSAQQADRGWAQIVKAHKALLEGLEPEVSKVNLGRKGTYFRLKAGPLDSADAAKEMCRKLKARRQFCEPTVLEGGG